MWTGWNDEEDVCLYDGLRSGADFILLPKGFVVCTPSPCVDMAKQILGYILVIINRDKFSGKPDEVESR